MTRFATWKNSDLHKPTCKCSQTGNMSDQTRCLIMCWTFCVIICEQDSKRFPTNKHFHPGAIKGREVWGGYSITLHYLFLSSLLRSSFCVDIHTTQWHKKAVWVITSSLPLLMSPSNNFSFQTKPNPCMDFRKKLSMCIIWGVSYNSIKFHRFKDP